ncbi:putative D-xylulose reductase A [Grifola frondosa]|uniref:Putative D-xylulose reductase A n=1 Tax=Grifola frondosa TaxID=5627 RepID=A0A1C7M5F2_GRIFR|nr:putative D-xylulose reductase A [Grifola frondosa]
MSDNPSFVLRGIEDVVYEERPIPEVTDDEVLVEVKKTGICGSDVHYLLLAVSAALSSRSRWFSDTSRLESYQKVKNLKVGDRVAMEPGATCRVCDDCKRGRYELCPDIVFAATPPYDGTLARYYRIPADLCYVLPNDLTLEDGAMMEPLSVAVHSVSNIAQLRANQSVVIFGAGPVGLLCMAVAKALGARRIIAVDIVPSRLEFARGFAATETYTPSPLQPGEPRLAYSERNANIMMQTLGIEERGPKSIDLVVDASGAEVSIQTGILIAKQGGTFVQVGMGAAEIVIPVTTLLVKELNFKGSFRYGPGDYQLAIGLVAAGKIDLKPLVTHRFAFKDAIEAFQTTRAGKSPDGKPVIKAVISGPDVPSEDPL